MPDWPAITDEETSRAHQARRFVVYAVAASGEATEGIMQLITTTLQKTKDELIEWTLRCDNDGDTALHLAALRRDDELCIYLSRLLLANGYNLNLRNNLLQTPVHIACLLANISLLKSLLEIDETQLTTIDRKGDTFMHLAIRGNGNDSDILRMILMQLDKSNKTVPFINTKNFYGQSALHVSASINKPEAIRLLVTYGAEIDVQDTKSGKTPLYIAVENNNFEAAKELLELGADANRLTYFRDSPSQQASTRNRRKFVQLISKYDSLSRSSSPTLECKRFNRRHSGMVNQDSLDSNEDNTQMSTNEESPTTAFKSDNGAPDTVVSTKVHSRRVSILGTGKPGEPPCVKREAVSPKSSAPSAYPVSVIENTMTRPSESETREMQTPSDQMTLSRDRRQFLLPPALAVSLYNQHMRNQTGRGATWSSLISPVVGGLQGFGLTHPLGLPQASSAIINEHHNEIQKSMTAQPQQATEMACVTDESTIGMAVSKRKQHGEICFSENGEPLDLSQPEDEATTVRVSGEDRVNMLLEGKMEDGGHPRESMRNSEDRQVQDLNEPRLKVKKEIVDDSAETQSVTKQQALRSHYPEKTLEQYRSPVPNFLHSTPNALAIMNHWLNFPAVLNPRTHFLPQGYGYIPTALPTVNAHHPLTGLDPAGLSQWFNLSMNMAARAADSSRYTTKTDRNSKPDRKRKASEQNDETEALHPRTNGDETTRKVNPTKQSPDSLPMETTNKRCKLNDSNEGLHRSVSDDPGKRRSGESYVQKAKIRRRNSEPSAGACPTTEQEGDKKGAPVDLRSYAGCLPPQCLHLLKASGNLSLGDGSGGDGRLNTDDATDTIDDSAKNGLKTNTVSTVQRNVANPQESRGESIQRAYPTITSNESATRKTWMNIAENSHMGKISLNAPVPINPRSGYFTQTTTPMYFQHYLFQKPPTVLPFVQNSRTFPSGNERKRYDSTSDEDDEHIQTLQISDASSDEEDDVDITKTNSSGNVKFPHKQQSKLTESIGFGKGPWADLDNGALTAFGAFNSNCTGENGTSSHRLNVPTKMACTVSKSFPQALNGLARTHSATKIKTDKKTEIPHAMLTSEEFRPHSEVTGPANEFSAKLLKLPTAATHVLKKKQNSNGCSAILSKAKQSEQKLIGDIFQKSFRNPNFRGHNTSSPRCVPRLVFTSELKPSAGISVGKEKKNGSDIELDSNRSKEAISVGEVRHIEIPQTSAPAYSHKLFGFARTATAKDGDNHNSDSVRSIVKQSSSEKTLVSSSTKERKKASLFSNSSLPFQSVTSRARGSSASSRTGTLDAKIGELRQKATERQGQKAEISEVVNKDEASSGIQNMMQTAPESMHFAERPSPPLSAGLESRYRSTGSPFYDSDVGRFGKRNIAVIKPNQSVLDGREKKTPGSTCPPKKRHTKRYSPELYSKSKVDSVMHDREVRSASPTPHTPFVSTNVLINNDEHSWNVQWCSPERSPNRRPRGSKATTILTLRGPSSHTVTFERNMRKYPRYSSSSQSDAVIVVQSRMARGALDERDQRLEIEDLEISDEETQVQ